MFDNKFDHYKCLQATYLNTAMWTIVLHNLTVTIFGSKLFGKIILFVKVIVAQIKIPRKGLSSGQTCQAWLISLIALCTK